MPINPGPKPSQSVLNALAILESFDARHAEQTLADISRRLSIPKSTALRNITALQNAGYLTSPGDNGTYCLGAQVLGPAGQFLSRYANLSTLHPILAELAVETGETAHIGVLQGATVVYTDIAESPNRVRAVVNRGDHLPAHCVATGKAILAHSEEAAVRRVLDAGLNRLTEHTICDAKAFQDELEATRSRGYGLNVEEWIADVVAISAPVFAYPGRVIAAVGIAAPQSRISRQQIPSIGRTVRRHADRASILLGGREAVDEQGD